MANYLTTVVSRDLEPAFLTWIAPHLPPGGREDGSPEHLVVELPGTTARLHHIARRAVDDLVRTGSGDGLGGVLFHGYAQSPEPGVTVFGAAGVRKLLSEGRTSPTDAAPGQEWDGPHLSVTWGEGRLSAHTDFFRSLPMLVTSGQGMLAVSDSWQVLVRLRTALGLQVTTDTEAACAQTVSRIITEHPMGSRTPCSQVRLLTVGSTVEARIGVDGVQQASVTQEPFAELFAEPAGTWQDTVRRAAASMASVLRSHVELGVPLRLSMSGGADSRAVLAAMRRADPAQDFSIITTANKGPANARDAEVVADLVATLGLHVGERPELRARTERYASPFQAWSIGSLGLHDRFQTPYSRVLAGSHYTLTGHGAGVFKATYGWRPYTGVSQGLEAFDGAGGTLAGRLGHQFLEQVGVDPHAAESSEWHFIGLRNALHGGRSTLTNLLAHPPLMQRRLTALAHVPSTSVRATPQALRRDRRTNAARPNTSMTSVMLSLLDPELASQPFDVAEKDIDPGTLATILEVAGGPLRDDELVAVRAYGHPRDLESGIAQTLLSLAGAWGFQGPMTPMTVAPLVEEGARIAEDLGLGEWYRPIAENARELLRDPDRPLSQQRGGYGKLLSFLPLATAGLDGPVPDRGTVERTVKVLAAARSQTARDGRARTKVAVAADLRATVKDTVKGKVTRTTAAASSTAALGQVSGRAWTGLRSAVGRRLPEAVRRPMRAAARRLGAAVSRPLSVLGRTVHR